MPHLQFEINKTVKKKLKKDFIVFIEKSFSKIMQTGKDHIAITMYKANDNPTKSQIHV